MAQEQNRLSSEEQAVLNKLGMSPGDVRLLNADLLKKRLQTALEKKIKPTVDELKNKEDTEKIRLRQDAQKLAGGYLISTVSLFTASLLAPQAIIACKTKPSAVIYAASAALYLSLEMANIKILKASKLAELEVVDDLSIDQDKSLKENAKLVKSKINDQIGYLKSYKKTLDDAFKALKKKARNAKMMSAGFLAASAAAMAEQMELYSGGGACVVYSGLQNETFKNAIPWSVSSFLMNRAVASDKVTLAPSLKNNQIADWMGDLDKLGIVGGAAVNIIAYMTGQQIVFLKSITSNGTSRSITFGMQGALAYAAGNMFDQAASSFIERMQKVDKILDQFEKTGKKGLDLIVPSDTDARRFQEIAKKVGVPSEKLITEMTLREASSFIDDTIEEAGNKLSEIEFQFLNQYAEKLEDKASEVQFDLESKFKKKATSSLDWLLGKATAAMIERSCLEKTLCSHLEFSKVNHPKMQRFNQYLKDYENYYQAVATQQKRETQRYARKLLWQRKNIVGLRDQLFKLKTAEGYSGFEKQKLNTEELVFGRFYQGLKSEEKAVLGKSLISFSAGALSKDKSNTMIINEKDLFILKGLIKKLEQTSGQSVNQVSMRDKSEDLLEEEKENNFNWSTPIHSKEAQIFEIIHHRYLNFYQRDLKGN